MSLTRFSIAPMVLAGVLILAVVATGAPQETPASSCPGLDGAAGAFAEGRLEEAIRGFETVARDASVAPFARSLALFGLAEVALAKQDSGDPIYASKLATARFYFAKLQPETAMLIRTARAGSASLMQVDEALF